MKRTSLLVLTICFVSLLVLASGCGGAPAPTSASSAPEKPSTTPAGKPMSTIVANYSKLSPDDVAAALEALRCAEDANCGSTFKAAQVRCQEGWARVEVVEIEVPSEEGVGFDVYLKERNPGKWDVVQTGTGLTAEDIPGAPEEIFEE